MVGRIMGTIYFACGCSISKSMFGDRRVMTVRHCEHHQHLFSENKTLRQMADEIYEAHATDTPNAEVSDGESPKTL
jgi:hypothetical protein